MRQPNSGNEYTIVPYRGKLAVAFGRGAERRRISTGTNDPGLAKVVAAEIFQKLNASASDRVVDLWASYIADRRKDGKDTSRQEYAWKHLQPHFGGRLGSDVNKDDCREYTKMRKRQSASPSTIKIELEYLRACLNLRYGRGLNQVWTPPASPPREQYLSKGEFTTLLSHATTAHVRLFIILAVTTGARMGAILALRWDQVDFKHRTINFNEPGREKTNKRRAQVPMNSRAFEALHEASRGALSDFVIEWDGKPLMSIKKAIQALSKRANVPCSPHVFRHTAAVWMAQEDVPMQKIAQFLGHTTTRETERTYARYSPSFMSDAAAALEF